MECGVYHHIFVSSSATALQGDVFARRQFAPKSIVALDWPQATCQQGILRHQAGMDASLIASQDTSQLTCGELYQKEQCRPKGGQPPVWQGG